MASRNGSPTLSSSSRSTKTNNNQSNNESENTTQPLNITADSQTSIYNTIASTSHLITTTQLNSGDDEKSSKPKFITTLTNTLPREKTSKDRVKETFPLPAQKDGIFGTLKKHAKKLSSPSFSAVKCDANRNNRPKRDKYNRAYYSMNETIEVLADQVIEDETLVSRVLYFFDSNSSIQCVSVFALIVSKSVSTKYLWLVWRKSLALILR